MYRSERRKQRPALVLSPNRLNKERTDIIVAAITSQIPDVIADDEILLSDADQRTAGLPKASIIKLGKIFTIHQGLIRKNPGHVPDSTLERILQQLLQSMQ